MKGALALVAVAVIGCGDSNRRPPAVADTTTAPAANGSDSLILTLPDSTGVWMVVGRADTSTTGEVCTERLLELRRDGRSLPVPLLYTIGTPTPINDSTLRAALYRHCAVQAWYRVDTRTGLPKPERES